MVDGDRLLVLAQKKLIKLAKECMVGINPLYYEMHKAKGGIIDNHEIYEGLRLAFTGGKIGGISNDITKIWNHGREISETEKNVMRWLVGEVNHVIDYAKTLYKPTRPKNIDNIIKSYTRAKVPYFFQYAKDKRYNKDPKKSQTEQYNSSIMNKITKEIKPNYTMFKPIKNLGQVDYLMLLKDRQVIYSNDEINTLFDKYNRKYGHNINFDDSDTRKNNIRYIAKTIKDELKQIKDNEDCIICSLVIFLYSKPSSRKKKLLWYMYGDKIYENIKNNLDGKPEFCWKCGKRTDEHLINGWCSECIKKAGGFKPITCVDCGKEFMVITKHNEISLCQDCKKIRKRERELERIRKKRQMLASQINT